MLYKRGVDFEHNGEMAADVALDHAPTKRRKWRGHDYEGRRYMLINKEGLTFFILC